MKTLSKSGMAFLLLLAFSCKKYENNATADAATTDSIGTSSTAAVEKNDPKHKFIRTADIKFKVQNVAKSTYAVENTIRHFGGFVTNTNLQSEVSDRQRTKISQDSIIETTRFTVRNDMTLRIPNTKLDTLLKSISKEVGFLDYRVIKAEDVSLTLLSNQMAQDRQRHNRQRMEKSIDEKGKKISDVNAVEDELLDKQETADTAKLQNLSAEDAVSFSTVTLQLYQNETMRREVLANPENMVYRTGFGTQLIDSFKTGWFMLEGIISFVLQFWTLIVLGSGAYFGYKKFGKKSKLVI